MTEPAKKLDKKTPVKGASPKNAPEPGLNDAKEWDRVHSAWSKRMENVQARADAYFMSDEEAPLRQHMLLVMVAAFVLVFILWAGFAKIDEVTKGQGKVIPTNEVQMVSSLEGGIVDKFFVREGQVVKVGESLLQLRDVQAVSDLGSNRQKYLSLKAKIQRLQAQIQGKATPAFTEDVMTGVPSTVQEELQAFRSNQLNLRSQTQVLEQELSQRRGEASEVRSKINDLRSVVSLAQQQRDMTAPMVERGSAPKMELLQLDREIKQQETDLNSQSSSLPRIQAAINEAQARINELTNSTKAQAQTDLTAATAEMNTILPTLSALEDRKTRAEVKSPVNGTVKDMKITTVGGVVQPGQTILEIVPTDDQLLIEANVRPADIAFIYPNQPAVVKLTAYDYSIYGGLTGKVVEISADSITNEKGESFYRVRVRTDENHLTRKGEVLNIIPGMVASVDIMTGKKTVMEYLMKPFVKTMRSAMRER